MVSEIFNSACEWKELLKIREYIENSNQVQNDDDANFRASTAAVYVYIQALVL